jgi:serine/threonine protein kinase
MERRRFRFLKKLSEGTFGKVYLAEVITDNNFSKVVAIKLLHAKWVDHDEIVQRSRDEARVLGRLQHRNIINVIDLISIKGKCAIIMEYLDGVDLKSLISYCSNSSIHIPRRVVFDIISSVSSALEAAYSRPPLQGGEPLRLIHRDIKPSNIMLTVEADVKVLDFGTAQARFDDREAKTQALAFGSAAYMSPERFMGEEDRISGDVYALGVTLYELLYKGRYGKSNVRPEQFNAERERRLEKIDLSDLSEELQERIMNLLLKMLAWEEGDRPDLREILHETEHLASLINDGTLKIFSREIVQDCKTSTAPNDEEADDLEGQTFFEDMSQVFQNSIDSFPIVDEKHPELDIVPPETSSEKLNFHSTASSAKIHKPSIVDDDESTAILDDESMSVAANKLKSSKRGIIGVVVLLLLLIGGGWVLVDKYESQPVTPVRLTPVVKKVGKPGKVNDFQATEKFGQATLIIKPPGAALVKISNSTLDYQYSWNGKDEMVLKNAPVGRYKTRFENTEKRLSGTFIEIEEGEVCVYTLDLKNGGTDWSKECSF